MKQLTLPAVCTIAALAVTPVFAAQADRSGKPGAQKQTECTFDYGKRQTKGKARRSAEPRDCIVVRGDPSRDGRATLRRSLTEDAKKNLKKTELPSLKKLFSKGRTS